MRKHFRLTMHFTVTGDESNIPTEGIDAKTLYTRTGDDEAWREGDDRMRRLYQAVISNKKVLHNYLESCISSWLETETSQHWDEILFAKALLDEHNELRIQDILHPAIATLSEEDRKIFTRQIANDVFFDNIEEFLDCFSTSLDFVKLTEVEMRREP